jgi:hypothetical protein
MNAIEHETNKPFSETKGRTTNPYLNPTRPSNISNNSGGGKNIDPKNDIEVTEPRRGTRNDINQPSKQSNVNNGDIHVDPRNDIEVTEPRRGTRNEINQPSKQSNINNGGVDPSKDIEIRNPDSQQPRRHDRMEQQPSKQSNINDGFEMQQPSRQYEQPSRSMEPSRSPQFDQPRNNGFTPRGGGSSSPSTNRPRR